MANNEEEEEQDRIWELLYGKIISLLQKFGVEDQYGNGDYLVVNDNYGWRRHKIEVQKLHMLRPEIVKLLQLLLKDFADWDIGIAVDIPGTEKTWPLMGLIIRRHEIIDGLLREYLPPDVRQFEYPGSRPGTGYD